MLHQSACPRSRPEGGLLTIDPRGTAGSEPMNLKSPNETSTSSCRCKPRPRYAGQALCSSLAFLALWLAGCAHAPIGADRVTPHMAYRQGGKAPLAFGK